MGLFKILPEKSSLLEHLAFRSDRLNLCVKLSLSESKRMTTTKQEERDFSGFDLEKDSRRT